MNLAEAEQVRRLFSICIQAEATRNVNWLGIRTKNWTSKSGKHRRSRTRACVSHCSASNSITFPFLGYVSVAQTASCPGVAYWRGFEGFLGNR
jgi:hypothetical protein